MSLSLCPCLSSLESPARPSKCNFLCDTCNSIAKVFRHSYSKAMMYLTRRDLGLHRIVLRLCFGFDILSFATSMKPFIRAFTIAVLLVSTYVKRTFSDRSSGRPELSFVGRRWDEDSTMESRMFLTANAATWRSMKD